MMIEVALILSYICVLLIKTCDPSMDRFSMVDDQRATKATCSIYGLGGTARGKRPKLAKGDAWDVAR